VLAPLMLWGISLGFDAMARFAEEPRLGRVALGPLVLGLALGVGAAALELHTVLRLPSAAENLKPAFWVLLADVIGLGLFMASVFVRLAAMDPGLARELSLLGFFTAMMSGFTRDLLGLRTVPERAPRQPVPGRPPVWPARIEEPVPPEL
jgi:hypothetical protein